MKEKVRTQQHTRYILTHVYGSHAMKPMCKCCGRVLGRDWQIYIPGAELARPLLLIKDKSWQCSQKRNVHFFRSKCVAKFEVKIAVTVDVRGTVF